jgi:hypothetical protein
MSEENKVRDALDAVTGLVTAVPVYQDVAQPAAKEIGKSLHTITKTVNILLAPFAGLIWSCEKIIDYVSERVSEKLKDIPPENVKTPEPNIVGPALEALRYTGFQEELREMYANLLATSMDSNTAKNAHPSFVEFIRQMSPDEALIMKYLSTSSHQPKIDIRAERPDGSGFDHRKNVSLICVRSGCAHPGLNDTYMVNLERLGLIYIRDDYSLQSADNVEIYDEIEKYVKENLKFKVKGDDSFSLRCRRGQIYLTSLGSQFCAACIEEGTHNMTSEKKAPPVPSDNSGTSTFVEED